MPRGVYSGLGAVGCSSLVEYVANVGVDGSDGDYELFGDLPVGLAVANQAENINLSLEKTSRMPLRQASLRLEISSHPPVGAGVASPSLSRFGGLLPAAPAPGGGPRYPCTPTERQRNSSRSRHIRVCGSLGTKLQGILKMMNSLGHVANRMGQHPQQEVNGDYRPFASYL